MASEGKMRAWYSSTSIVRHTAAPDTIEKYHSNILCQTQWQSLIHSHIFTPKNINNCYISSTHFSKTSTYQAVNNIYFRVVSKALCLINSPAPTDCFQSLKHRHNVAPLSILYWCFHGNCSSELANCMPPHPSAASFIPFTGKLWHPLSDFVFPPSYDLNSFKYQDTCMTKLIFFWILSPLCEHNNASRFFFLLCVTLGRALNAIKKKKSFFFSVWMTGQRRKKRLHCSSLRSQHKRTRGGQISAGGILTLFS